MAFDPNQPFSVEPATAAPAPVPAFDPSAPHEVVPAAPAFDPSKPAQLVDPKDDLTAQFGELKPGSWKDVARFKLHEFSQGAGDFWEKLNEPLVKLPDAPAMPDIPHMGIQNPALVAGIYQGVIKPAIEGAESAFGVGTFGVGGALGAAKGVVPYARTAEATISGAFTALMASNAVQQAPQVKAVLDDPNSTTQQKVAAVSGIAGTVGLGALGALGVHDAFKDSALETRARTMGYTGNTPEELKDWYINKAAEKATPVSAVQTDVAKPLSLDAAAQDKWNAAVAQPLPAEAAKPTVWLDLAGEKPGSEAPTVAVPVEVAPAPAEAPDISHAWNAVVNPAPVILRLDKDGNVTHEETPAAAPATVPDETAPVEQAPVEEHPDALPAYAAKGAALLERGLNPEQWTQTMAAETGLDPQQLLAVRKMSDTLMGEGGKLDTRKLIDLATGVTQPEASTLAAPVNDKSVRALRVKARALISQIDGMMSVQDAMATYYKGQEQAAGAAASMVRGHLVDQDRLGRQAAVKIRRDLLDLVGELPKEDQADFTAAITEALRRPMIGNNPDGMFQRSAAVAFRILHRLDLVEKQDVIGKIQKVADKVAGSPGVDVEYQKQIAAALAPVALKMPGEAKMNSLRGTQDYLNRVGENNSVPEEIKQQLAVLTQTPARDLPLSVLNALLDRVKLLEHLGRTVVNIRTALYDGEKAAVVAKIQSSKSQATNDAPISKTPGVVLPLPARLQQSFGNSIATKMNYARRVDQALMVSDAVMDTMDGNVHYKGAIVRIIKGGVDLDFNTELSLRRSFHEPFVALSQKYGTYSNNELERIGIYAIAQEENGVERLADSNVSQALIDHVNATITPKEKAFYDTARHVLDDVMFPALKHIMRELYNMDVTHVDKYWMFQQDRDLIDIDPTGMPTKKMDNGAAVGLDELATFKALLPDLMPRRTTKTDQGVTIERLPDAHGALKINAGDGLAQHIDKVAHILATQRNLKMFGEIVRQPWFKEKYGNLGQDYMLDFLDTISRNSSPAGSTRTALLDVLNHNLSVGIVGGRLIGELKHATNFAPAVANVKPNFLFFGLTEMFTPRGQALINRLANEVGQRFGGESAIQSLAEGSKFRAAQAWSFFVARGFDALFARMSFIGRYAQELQAQGLDWRNYSSIPDNIEAQKTALQTTRLITTSVARKDQSQMFSRGKQLPGGQNVSVKNMLLLFQNTMNRQWSYIRHDVGALGVKNLNPTQLAVAMLVVIGWVSGETAVTELNRYVFGSRKPRPDETVKDLATDVAKRVPFAGNVVGQVVYGETGIPVIDVTTAGGKSGVSLYLNQNKYGRPLSPGARDRQYVRLGQVAAELAGIPGSSNAGEYAANHVLQPMPPAGHGVLKLHNSIRK